MGISWPELISRLSSIKLQDPAIQGLLIFIILFFLLPLLWFLFKTFKFIAILWFIIALLIIIEAFTIQILLGIIAFLVALAIGLQRISYDNVMKTNE